MAVTAYQMDGLIPVRPARTRGYNRAQNLANKFAETEYGYKGRSNAARQRDLDTQMLGIDMSSNRQKQAPANWADIDAATFGAVTNGGSVGSPGGPGGPSGPGSPGTNADDWGSGGFSSRASDEAYLNWQTRRANNQLKRARWKEDYGINRKTVDLALEQALRKLPGRYNQIGMRNSGVFNRDVGEFERDSQRKLADMERMYRRGLQDFNLNDLRSDQKYYRAIGDDAEEVVLAKAAAAANINPGILSGGNDVNRAASTSILRGAL